MFMVKKSLKIQSLNKRGRKKIKRRENLVEQIFSRFFMEGIAKFKEIVYNIPK